MHRRRLLGASAAVLLLAACAKDTPPPAPAPVALTQAAPIRLAVGSIDISEGYAPVEATSFIDKRRSQDLVNATRTYLQEKVQAAGGPGFVRAVIEKATLIERPRPDASAVKGFFLNQPTKDLAGDLQVRLIVVGPSGTERAYSVATVGASRGISDTASIQDRDRIAQELTQDLMLQLERSLRQSVDEGLKDYKA
jgi:hypothetical protein